jgi:hypothetical protein
LKHCGLGSASRHMCKHRVVFSVVRGSPSPPTDGSARTTTGSTFQVCFASQTRRRPKHAGSQHSSPCHRAPTRGKRWPHMPRRRQVRNDAPLGVAGLLLYVPEFWVLLCATAAHRGPSLQGKDPHRLRQLGGYTWGILHETSLLVRLSDAWESVRFGVQLVGGLHVSV